MTEEEKLKSLQDDYFAGLVIKWAGVLDFSSDEVPKITDPIQRRIISILCEWCERKYLPNYDLCKETIPLARKYGFNAFIQHGEYSPTKGQPFHGETFKAVKLLNPDQTESKYIAIPFDSKYGGVEKQHTVAQTYKYYSYTFDF